MSRARRIIAVALYGAWVLVGLSILASLIFHSAVRTDALVVYGVLSVLAVPAGSVAWGRLGRVLYYRSNRKRVL